MVKCVIIDDEPSAIEVLTHHIMATPFLTLCGAFKNPVEGLEYTNKNSIDLIFLDVNMPQLNGLQLASILDSKIKVIMISAHSKYAVDGFELDVMDYLVKPVSFARFMKGVQKVLNANKITTNPQGVDEIPNDYFFVKTETKGKMVRVNFADIIYIKNAQNYVTINCLKQSILVLTTMKELDELLPKPQFIRVHKSYIVPTMAIVAIEGNHLIIKDSPERIPLGDVYKTAFHELTQGKVLNIR